MQWLLRLSVKLFYADKWNLGIVYQTIDSLMANKRLNTINWLKEDVVDYAADPFILEKDGKWITYYEELNFWKGNGAIMAIQADGFAQKHRVRGFSPSKIHLSYPYIAEANGKVYCLPETSAANEIALYQFDKSDPYAVKKIKVLVAGKPYVDSSIIFFENKYWLFTSVSGINGQLYIFYADKIDGEYRAHFLNPITVDQNACRSAGSLFIHQGALYRPTQNVAKCYGGSIRINRIVYLTETRFKAEYVFDIQPDEKYSQGTHHLSFAPGKIVIDGKRRVFALAMPIKKMVRKILQ